MEIRLNRDELLLLDWILTYPMPTSGPVELDWHMHTSWRALREQVWAKLRHGGQGGMVWIDDQDGELLLALIPTTFRWATGEDCGYSLKLKLSAALAGEEGEEAKDEEPKGYTQY